MGTMKNIKRIVVSTRQRKNNSNKSNIRAAYNWKRIVK